MVLSALENSRGTSDSDNIGKFLLILDILEKYHPLEESNLVWLLRKLFSLLPDQVPLFFLKPSLEKYEKALASVCSF